jgi:hypothetical protein
MTKLSYFFNIPSLYKKVLYEIWRIKSSGFVTLKL